MQMMRRVQVAVAVLLCVAVGLVIGPVPATHAQLEELITNAKPAVVVVIASRAPGKSGHGSGFIFHPSGFVLTNHHVVEGATEITVLLPDRRRFRATVVDYIRRVDFACPPRVETWIDAAILKIEGEGFPVLPLGDSDTLRQGQEILVMGYPGGVGIDEVSVTRGIVGAVRVGWLQTDAVMLPGNSGGPVLDRSGRVVGLATFGTGMFLRIGGIVPIKSIRGMVDAAPTPGAARVQEIRVTGREYAGPVVVGRRLTYRSAPTGPSEQIREVTQVTNLAGALVYTVRRTGGGEAQNYLGADGLFTLALAGGTSRVTYPEPLQWLPFPPCPGVTWSSRWREEQTDGTIRRVEVASKIDGAGETVTVPAGAFAQTLKIVETFIITETRGGRTSSFRNINTEWWAPGVGLVRAIEEATAGAGRWTMELISHFVPSPP
ncbi:MAG: trypsin-like peptidase domain-containing protein [bacterium]|nr:trypsin-like peptidase domain-containing protein [bacterium]